LGHGVVHIARLGLAEQRSANRDTVLCHGLRPASAREEHPRAAVHNNVLGTWLVAKAAGEHGAERFILVSTDKAVRPANVMGATKRVAELVSLYLQDSYPNTAFGAVRFGNVLGSSGSVIPLFKRQPEAGEPLTVTHEDVTRFFMTIPEAVQLILQASLLPKIKGGIAMLEMGEPVPIIELAKNLLRVSGKSARVGRDIVITGLRPGKKAPRGIGRPRPEGDSGRYREGESAGQRCGSAARADRSCHRRGANRGHPDLYEMRGHGR